MNTDASASYLKKALKMGLVDDPDVLAQVGTFYRAGKRGFVHVNRGCYKLSNSTATVATVRLSQADLASARLCPTCLWRDDRSTLLYFASRLAEALDRCSHVSAHVDGMPVPAVSGWLDWVSSMESTARACDEPSLSRARSRVMEALDEFKGQLAAHLAACSAATLRSCATNLPAMRAGLGLAPSSGPAALIPVDAAARLGYFGDTAYRTWEVTRPLGREQARKEVLADFEALCRLGDLAQLDGVDLPPGPASPALAAVEQAWRAHALRDVLACLDSWEEVFSAAMRHDMPVTVLVNRPLSSMSDETRSVLRSFEHRVMDGDRIAGNYPQLVAWWLDDVTRLTVVSPGLTAAQLEMACVLWEPLREGPYRKFREAAEAARLL